MITIRIGDCRAVLATMPDNSVNCIVTSPPYFALRDYGHDDQIGLEQTPEAYVAELVRVFREARRVLRDDGTCWLNLGDSYYNYRPGGISQTKQTIAGNNGAVVEQTAKRSSRFDGIKEKDLIGIPWRVAFALQADGWWLRQDIIWHKPNPMPESVTDRCTKAHEYVFMLSKAARYWYDAGAIAEPSKTPAGLTWEERKAKGAGKNAGVSWRNDVSVGYASTLGNGKTVNRRSVWPIATRPYSGAHFATMPPELAELCIKAGCRQNGTVLDPFGGAGTTGLVADRLNRNAILIELNPEYAELARQRIAGDAPMFAQVEVIQ